MKVVIFCRRVSHSEFMRLCVKFQKAAWLLTGKSQCSQAIRTAHAALVLRCTATPSRALFRVIVLFLKTAAFAPALLLVGQRCKNSFYWTKACRFWRMAAWTWRDAAGCKITQDSSRWRDERRALWVYTKNKAAVSQFRLRNSRFCLYPA